MLEASDAERQFQLDAYRLYIQNERDFIQTWMERPGERSQQMGLELEQGLEHRINADAERWGLTPEELRGLLTP